MCDFLVWVQTLKCFCKIIKLISTSEDHSLRKYTLGGAFNIIYYFLKKGNHQDEKSRSKVKHVEWRIMKPLK